MAAPGPTVRSAPTAEGVVIRDARTVLAPTENGLSQKLRRPIQAYLQMTAGAPSPLWLHPSSLLQLIMLGHLEQEVNKFPYFSVSSNSLGTVFCDFCSNLISFTFLHIIKYTSHAFTNFHKILVL